MQVVLVQLQQEHDQAVESVAHEEDEHGLVAQLGQVGGDASLWEGWIFVSDEVGGLFE